MYLFYHLLMTISESSWLCKFIAWGKVICDFRFCEEKKSHLPTVLCLNCKPGTGPGAGDSVRKEVNSNPKNLSGKANL